MEVSVCLWGVSIRFIQMYVDVHSDFAFTVSCEGSYFITAIATIMIVLVAAFVKIIILFADRTSTRTRLGDTVSWVACF